MSAADPVAGPLLVGLLCAAAVALAVPPRVRLAPVAVAVAGASAGSTAGTPRVARWAWPLVLLVPLATVGGTQTALGAIGVGVALGGRQLRQRQRRATDAASAQARATEFCEAVAAELSVGAPPHHALASAAADFTEFVPVATSARLGGDVPAAFRSLASRPGFDDLRLVAAAWQVSHRSGAGLADALHGVGATLRARRRVGRLVAAELAAARATARIMAALPVVFVLAGSGLGADPLGFLVGGPAGVACLGSGLLLTWTGLAWLQRISESVSR